MSLFVGWLLFQGRMLIVDGTNPQKELYELNFGFTTYQYNVCWVCTLNPCFAQGKDQRQQTAGTRVLRHKGDVAQRQDAFFVLTTPAG
jgi:hypothetical protein